MATMSNALTFPPFPPAKDGVIAFKDYQERGIMTEPVGSGDGTVEVDAWGIPTVALTNGHDADACKTAANDASLLEPGQSRPRREDLAEHDRNRSDIHVNL